MPLLPRFGKRWCTIFRMPTFGDFVMPSHEMKLPKTKKCSVCCKYFPLVNFYKCERGYLGLRSDCKRCEWDRRKRYRDRNPEKFATWQRNWLRRHRYRDRLKLKTYRNNYYRLNRQKLKAHKAVYRATLKGILVRPSTCSLCGSSRSIEAHHSNYLKPLDVKWLCRRCHGRLHHAKENSSRARHTFPIRE